MNIMNVAQNDCQQG